MFIKIEFFLCSVYTPMCDVNTHYLIGPCRPLCEHVRARCAPVLRVFDFDWPENLNCSRFPVKNSVGGAMCMEGPEDLEEDINTPQNSITNSHLKERVIKSDYKDLPLDSSMKQVLQAITVNDHKFVNHEETIKEEGFTKLMEKLTAGDLSLIPRTTKDFLPSTLTSHLNKYPLTLNHLAQSIRHCSYLKKPTFYVYINRTGRCAPLCEADILYTTEAKTLSTMWTSVLAGICCLVTTFTLIRYAMNPSDFRPNEKPIVYIALCQLFFALGYGLSLGLGRETVTCGRDMDSGQKIRLQEGLDNPMCAFVFMIQYFFSIASYIWWTMLVFHWTLQRTGAMFACFCCASSPSTHSHLPSPPLLPPIPSTYPVMGNNSTTNPNGKQFKNCCFKMQSLCLCSENSMNWNKSEIIMNEGVYPPKNKDISPNQQLTTSSSLHHQQQQVVNINGSGQMTKLTHSLTPCTRHNDALKRDYCWSALSPNQRHIIFTSKSDQITACLAKEHLVAWLTAGLFTVGVLVSRQVDADELIPVCGVGHQNTSVLGAFILGPQTVLITLGSITFMIGFICLLPCFRKRKCFCWRQFKTKPTTSHSQSVYHHNQHGSQQQYTQYKQENHNPKMDSQSTGNNVSSHVNNSFTTHARSSFNKSTITRSHCQSAPISNPLLPHPPYEHPSNQCFYNHASQRFYQSCKNSSHPSSDPMEFRIGLFCFLYLIPLICMNACDLYEYLYRDEWLSVPGHKNLNSNGNNRNVINDQYHKVRGSSFSPDNINLASYLWNVDEVFGPNPELFMLRIFMSLVTGFTCSLWMWTVKGCHLNCDYCLCLSNNGSTLKQKRRENQLILKHSKAFGVTKENFLCSNELVGCNNSNNNNPSNSNHKRTFTQTPEGTTYTLHPYAIYQYTKSSDGYNSQHRGGEGRCEIVGCSATTTGTAGATDNKLDCNQSNFPITSLLTQGHLTQLDTGFVLRDMEHSTATTPGYYSHAKISPNMIIDSMSEDASTSSIPPPLPPSNNRPPRLPARGDPCVGASSSQVFGFTNKINMEQVNNNKTCNKNNNNSCHNSNETENYNLMKFKIPT
ncbi:unnamed protein product [Heterobilharzia americana]|nr:unnamed protein product [Heterobilharzia americana]